jgi:hypothetical protein
VGNFQLPRLGKIGLPLTPGDVQVSELQIHLIPPKRDKLAHAEAMAVGQQDQPGVPWPVSSETTSGGHEALNLVRQEILS